jgi:RNA polymerase sigma-70 factor (ECF subfamily)
MTTALKALPMLKSNLIIKLLPGRKRTADRFWELTRDHVNFLYNMALRYAGNQYDAEDLVQETFFVGFKKFDQLRDENKIKYWLFTILRNTYFKARRQNEHIKNTEFDEGLDYISTLENTVEQTNVVQEYEKKIESDHIQQILDELPDKHKTPLLLYYMSGLSYQEIAETLDLPIGTIMSRLSRGKQTLKKKLLRHQLQNARATNVIKFPKQNIQG